MLGGLRPAGATLIHAPFPQIGVDQLWDANEDGTADFAIIERWQQSHDVPPSVMSYSFSIYPTDGSYLLGVGSAASVLAGGAEIATDPTAPDGWQSPSLGPVGVGYGGADLLEGVWLGWSGPMENVEEGYLGLRFLATDGVHLGWLRVRREEHTDLFLNRIVPVDFAWETRPDTTLVAGAVPEPIVLPLMLLGSCICAGARGKAKRK